MQVERQNMYVHVKTSDCVFACVNPSVDSSVCVWVRERVCFYSVQQDLQLWRMPSCTAEGKTSQKTNGLCLLSSCYLTNVFNEERKAARCPKHSHITHVHLPLGSLPPFIPFHQSMFFIITCQFSSQRHGAPQIPFVCFWNFLKAVHVFPVSVIFLSEQKSISSSSTFLFYILKEQLITKLGSTRQFLCIVLLQNLSYLHQSCIYTTVYSVHIWFTA